MGERFSREETLPYSPHLLSGEQQEPKGKIPVDNIKLKRERTGRDGDTDLGIIYVKKILEIMKFDSLTTESS